jgi:hypothetical protein
MPVAASIHWKPLRDSHYVIASLQPGGGGRREIFIAQNILTRILSLASAPPGVEVRGLLIGQRLDCTLSPTRYVLIDSMVEVAASAPGENALADAVAKHTPKHRAFANSEVLGWYYRNGTSEARLSEPIARAHVDSFPHPWQTALILSDNWQSGGFYLADSVDRRWFRAPFYEITQSKAGKRAEKPTCVAWQEYLTADRVVYIEPPRAVYRTPATGAPVVATPTSVRTQESAPKPLALTSALKKAGDATKRLVADTLARKAADVRDTLSTSAKSAVREASATVKVSSDRISELRVARAAKAAERRAAEREARAEAERQAAKALAERLAIREREEREAAERRRAQRQAEEQAVALKTTRAADIKVADVGAQRHPNELTEHQAAEALAKQQAAQMTKPTLGDVVDEEDTTARDRPYRYLALARREGFVVDASYERGVPDHPETLWVLSEPDTGLMLTVVTSDSEVREAILQYNLHVDDAEILEAAPPEERDMTSGTLYFREPCANRLRARVRRLRATGALEREWKVGHQGIGPDDWGTIQGIHLTDDSPSPVSQNGSGVNSSDAHPR